MWVTQNTVGRKDWYCKLCEYHNIFMALGTIGTIGKEYHQIPFVTPSSLVYPWYHSLQPFKNTLITFLISQSVSLYRCNKIQKLIFIFISYWFHKHIPYILVLFCSFHSIKCQGNFWKSVYRGLSYPLYKYISFCYMNTPLLT